MLATAKEWMRFFPLCFEGNKVNRHNTSESKINVRSDVEAKKQ